MKLENRFRERFVGLLKDKYGDKVYLQKHHGSIYSAGLPDMLALRESGVVFMELKAVEELPARPDSVVFDFTKEPTALQAHTMRTIEKAKAGTCWLVVWFKAPKLVMVVPFNVLERARAEGWTITKARLLDNRFAGAVSWDYLKQVDDPLTVMRIASERCDWY